MAKNLSRSVKNILVLAYFVEAQFEGLLKTKKIQHGVRVSDSVEGQVRLDLEAAGAARSWSLAVRRWLELQESSGPEIRALSGNQRFPALQRARSQSFQPGSALIQVKSLD